jgi:hypothetical protein
MRNSDNLDGESAAGSWPFSILFNKDMYFSFSSLPDAYPL